MWLSNQGWPGNTAGSVDIGSHASAASPTTTPKNSGRATPTMVNGTLPTRSVRPITPGSPPYARCQ